MIPWSSSVFSRSARIFEEMPSSDLVSSSRKCRRFPNIMSRITSRLHLSPTTSSVRLIGHPERWSSVIKAIQDINRLQRRTSYPKLQPVAKYNWLGEGVVWLSGGAPAKSGRPHVTHAAFPSAVVVLLEGADRPLRERYAVRAAYGRSRQRSRARGAVEAVADRKIPGAAR